MHRFLNLSKLRGAVVPVLRNKGRVFCQRPMMEPIEPRILFTALDGSEVVGLPSDMKTSLYTFIGDHSSSNSEKWDMTVGGHTFSAANYGDVQRDLTEYKKGETYDIAVIHQGSNRYVNGVNTPDYDYRAWVDKYASPAWTSGATVASGPTYFVTETNNPALIQKRWFGANANNAAGKTAQLVIPGIDLDVDTANNDGFGTVTDNVAEDVDEFDSAKGKYIIADTGDMDSDGIKDNADFNGVAGVSFVPVFVRLPANMQLTGASLANINLSFSYAAADLTGNETDIFRLWTVDASSARGATELLSNGESVSAASLGMTFGGTTKLYMECVKGATSNRPLTVTATVAGTAWSGTLQDQVHFTPIGFKVKSVVFEATDSSRQYDVTSDDGNTTYDDLHWQDTNLDGDADDVGDHKYPVAYRREATMVTGRNFQFVAPSSFVTDGTNFVVRGEGTGGYNFWAQSNTVGPSDPLERFNKLGTTLTTSDTASIPFPNWIDHFDPMTIKWSFSTDAGTNFNSVGDTKNQVYTFLEKPIKTASPLYHTVAHIATRLSKGMSDSTDVTAAIWSEFTDQDVRTATTTGAPASKQLKYYGSYQTLNTTTKSLLTDGDGQCSTWASLFIDALRSHGIDNAEYMLLTPNDLNGNGDSSDEGFLVKSWNFAGAGTSGNPAYPYVNFFNTATGYVGATSYNWYSADVTDLAGTPAQGNPNPKSIFNNHQVVRINGTYYDPSAGVSHASLAALESTAIEGYFQGPYKINESVIGHDVNGDGDMLDDVGMLLITKNPVGNQLHEDVVAY